MSIMFKAGRVLGQGAAYAWEGSRLGATQMAQGAKDGYVHTAEELRAKRLAIAATQPVVQVQKRVSVKTVKA